MTPPGCQIATAEPDLYLDRMISRYFRFLALAALVLMSFTMSAAPGEAHAMPQATADGHCDDHGQPQAPSAPDMADCMLMCAALPAAESITITALEVPKAPRRLALSESIHGIILEIATPPPRAA